MADVTAQNAPAPAPAATAAASPIYLLAGQSNMVGRGIPSQLPPELVARVSDSGAEIMIDLERHRPEEAHATEGWVPLTPGCQSHPQHGEHFGPEWGIANRLLDDVGQHHRLRFVKYGMGSSSVVVARGDEPEWLPEGEHVTQLITMARDACASAEREGCGVYLAGLFWNQGNSDLKVKADDGSAQLYTDRLVELVTRLRRELGGLHRGLPVVARHVCKGSSNGGPLTAKKKKHGNTVNQAMDAAFAEGRLERSRCLPLPATTGSVVLLDSFHFDGPTTLALGKEAAEEMLKLVASEPEPVTRT